MIKSGSDLAPGPERILKKSERERIRSSLFVYARAKIELNRFEIKKEESREEV